MTEFQEPVGKLGFLMFKFIICCIVFNLTIILNFYLTLKSYSDFLKNAAFGYQKICSELTIKATYSELSYWLNLIGEKILNKT